MSDVVESPQGSEFPGAIGRTVEESSPAWPAPTRARDGAPNVLFVGLDRFELRSDNGPLPERRHALRYEFEGLSCGFDFGAPAAEYAPPFPFTGTIRQVAVDLAGELIDDDEATLRVLMAQG